MTYYRKCPAPRCNNIIKHGRYCDACQASRPAFRSSRDASLTRHQRGYGNDWTRLRNAHLMMHPLCVECDAIGLTVAATDVDHIKPFKGLLDPLRLDASNLQSLCRQHHRSKPRV